MTALRTSPWRAAMIVAADIKIAHSVFAMPFAILAAFMAAAAGGPIDWRRFAGQLMLVVLAMVLARTVAMLANRLLDREIDARNPRTAARALPSGRVSPAAALGALVACAVAFIVVCGAFGAVYGNWWPALLALPVLAWLAAYPLGKRLTALAHLHLGSALAISPLAAALAIEPSALGTQPALWALSAMVLCWVAGFDVIYALQDVEVDRAQGLHSMPSRLGVRRALWASRLLHALAGGALVAAAVLDPRFGAVFFAGVGVVLGLLVSEHLTVARWGTSRIALAFFTLNGTISCVLGLLGVIDVIVSGTT